MKSNGPPEVRVTLRQAAEARPPCHRETLLELIHAGELPYERPSQWIYKVKMSDVDKALAKLARQSA